MNRLKGKTQKRICCAEQRRAGKKSLEDEAAELIEGVDEDEWDDY